MELLILLVITVLGFAVVAINISAGRDTLEIKAVAQDMVSALRYVRGQALITHRDAPLSIDLLDEFGDDRGDHGINSDQMDLLSRSRSRRLSLVLIGMQEPDCSDADEQKRAEHYTWDFPFIRPLLECQKYIRCEGECQESLDLDIGYPFL